MEHFELIRQLAGQWNAFSVFLQKYGMYLTAAAGLCTAELFPGIPAAEIMDCARQLSCGIRCRSGGLHTYAAFPALVSFGSSGGGNFLCPAGISAVPGRSFYPVLGSHCIPPAAASPSGIHGCPGSLPHRRRRRRRLCSGPGAGDSLSGHCHRRRFWFCFSSAVSRRTGQPSPHHSADSDSGLSGHSGSAEAMEEQRLLGAGRSESAAGKSGAGQAPQVPEEAETERKKGETKKTAPEKT